MAAPNAKTPVHDVLEHAHHPGVAHQIYTDKVQFRQLFLRPTSPTPDDAAAKAEAAAATGHNGREARREARRIKQEQRQARQPKPKPLSAHERRRMGLAGSKASKPKGAAAPSRKMAYDTFIPLHRLWLGYIREVLGPQELRTGGQGAAAKLTAADFHGAEVEVTRSACVGRVGIRGIVVRDARFVFEVVTRHNEVKMVPKEGTFFRVEIPVEDEPQEQQEQQPPKLVFEIVGSQFLHRATDRANRKFKQHFYKEL